MPEPTTDPVPSASAGVRSSTRSALLWVAVATVFAAGSGFLVTLLAARILAPAAYSQFAAAWALLYLVVGALNGVQQEVARTVSDDASGDAESTTAVAAGAEARISRSRPLWSGVLIVSIMAGALVSLALLMTRSNFSPEVFGWLWMLVPASLFIGGQMQFAGILVGQQRLPGYALVLIGEASVRLVLFVFAALGVIEHEVGVLVLLAMLPFAAWTMGLISPVNRHCVFGTRTMERLSAQTLGLAEVGLAALLTSGLSVGLPLVITVIVGDSAPAAEIGVIILLITLTRAPILVPLNAFQSTLISYFVRTRSTLLPRLAVVLVGVAVVGAVLSITAGLWGNPLIVAVFGAEYATSGGLLLAITASMVPLGIQTVMSSALLAQGGRTAYLVSWAVTTGVTLALLFVPLPFATRVCLALGTGPLAGAVVAAVRVWTKAHVESMHA